MFKNSFIALSIIMLFTTSCGSNDSEKKEENAEKGDTVATAASQTLRLISALTLLH